MNQTKHSSRKLNFFECFASKVAEATGSTAAIISAFFTILIWGVTGPVFNYSEYWQLIINTGTTIVTFLMVFLIQKSQNKESLSIQLKLNELLAANELASNRLVNVECMTEDELKMIKEYYTKLNEMAVRDKTLLESHSIDEAEQNHAIKNHLKDEAYKEFKTKRKIQKVSAGNV